MKSLLKDAIERDRGNRFRDAPADLPRYAVRRACLRGKLAHLARQRAREGCRNRAPILLRIDHRLAAQAAPLPRADIDRGRTEGRRLDEAARGIADDRVDVLERAQILKPPERRIEPRAL